MFFALLAKWGRELDERSVGAPLIQSDLYSALRDILEGLPTANSWCAHAGLPPLDSKDWISDRTLPNRSTASVCLGFST